MAGSSDAAPGAGAPMLRLLPFVGSRPREVTGSVGLVTHYGLHDIYNHFCRKPLQASIADSPYLQQVVGQTELRRGDSMEFSQLLPADPANQAVKIQPFDLQVLQRAFILRETGPIELPEADKGLATICGNVKYDQEKKHRKKHKKHKHREKDKDADNDRGKGEDGEDHFNEKHRKKKRKHGEAQEDGESHKHKRKKNKHSPKTKGMMKMENDLSDGPNGV